MRSRSLGNLAIAGLSLRKRKFKGAPRRAGKAKRDLAELMNSYLITPDAIIPFECSVRDDYGLVHTEAINTSLAVEDIDLIAQAEPGKEFAPADGDTATRRNGLVVSNFQFWPGNPQSYLFGPHFMGWTDRAWSRTCGERRKITWKASPRPRASRKC